MSFQLMKERIKQSGTSLYDEQIKDAQDILAYGFTDDVSYNRHIMLYNTNKHIPIKIYDQKYSASYGFTAQFLSPHDIPVELGEILYNSVKNEYWLCIESYDVSGIHNEGKLGKCSRLIKWQENDGSIYEIPVIARNATQYNNGESSDKVITLGSDQIILYTQLNEHTKRLDHGIKFFMDENKDNPTVYELTKPDTVDYSYFGKGMISLMLTECNYSPSEKELELGVCNYKDISPPNYPNEMVVLKAIIFGNTDLKIKFPRTYTVTLYDEAGNVVDWDNTICSWNIESEFIVSQTVNGNKINLLVNDELLIGKSFLLQVFINNSIAAETRITITDML